MCEERVYLDSIDIRLKLIEERVSKLDKEVDMAFRTPFYKRILFRLDGWPLHEVVNETDLPRRPWRKWWTS